MKYKQDERNKYIKYADMIISKRKSFYEKFKIKDIKNDVILSKDYDYLYYLKNDYLYYNFVSKALNEIYLKKDDYTAIFLTLTLDSKAHRYKKNKKGKLIYNSKYDDKFTINRGYQILNKFFRTLYKDFRINRKYIHFDFVKVIEPHSDFTPHLHSIIYIKNSYLKAFLSFVDTQVSKNPNLGRYEVEILNKLSRANAYLIKYLQKSYVDNLNENDLKMFLGWRLKNKIRMFTSSQKLHFRNVFNKFGFTGIGKYFIRNLEEYSEFYGTDNLYTYYSKVASGVIRIFESEKMGIYDVYSFASGKKIDFGVTEETSKIYFEIEKERIKKKNELYEKYIYLLSSCNNLDILLEILKENEKIYLKFDDFLFFEEGSISFKEFEDNPNLEIIERFIEFLNKNLFYYQYKTLVYKVYSFTQDDYIVCYDKNNYKVIDKFIKSEKSYQSIPKSIKSKIKINDYTKEKVTVKSISQMSELEKFVYKQELQAEKQNPFADDRYLKHIKDKEYILNKFA